MDAVATKNMIEIHARENVIPKFMISPDIREISKNEARIMDVYRHAPTLAQLRHAHDSRNEIRDSMEASLLSGEINAEITADFIDYDVEKPPGLVLPKGYSYVKLYSLPECLRIEESIMTAKHYIVAEGEYILTELPPPGWQFQDYDMLWNPVTGLSPRTAKSRNVAVRELSKIMPEREAERQVSYFNGWNRKVPMLMPVIRYSDLGNGYGRFSIDALSYSPLVHPSYQLGHKMGSRRVNPVEKPA
ncbi:hypothetical protein HY501_02255 [Candidatus Woesearchaeota archaeon]|nr:hypothetical protein [Candidatus Woesearchaeota archaeon]